MKMNFIEHLEVCYNFVVLSHFESQVDIINEIEWEALWPPQFLRNIYLDRKPENCFERVSNPWPTVADPSARMA